MSDTKLPPLPEPGAWAHVNGDSFPTDGYTTAQMIEYALAALAAAPVAQQDAWHQAAIDHCMSVKSCYEPTNPRKTISNLIDWHVAAERDLAPVAQQQEPVEYQYRTRPTWDERRGWSEWIKCSPESYEDYIKSPVVNDWAHEARKLYAAPVAAPAEQGKRKPNCLEVPPGNGFCDLCAVGEHENCRYVVGRK